MQIERTLSLYYVITFFGPQKWQCSLLGPGAKYRGCCVLWPPSCLNKAITEYSHNRDLKYVWMTKHIDEACNLTYFRTKKGCAVNSSTMVTSHRLWHIVGVKNTYPSIHSSSFLAQTWSGSVLCSGDRTSLISIRDDFWAFLLMNELVKLESCVIAGNTPEM